MVLPEMLATRPALQTWRAMSGVFQWERGTPWVAGNSQASALTCTTSAGGKNPGPARAGALLQAGQAFLEKPLSPHADDFATSVESCGNLIVGQTTGRQQNHLGADDFKIRQRIFHGAAMEFIFFLGRQTDGEGTCSWQSESLPALKMPYVSGLFKRQNTLAYL